MKRETECLRPPRVNELPKTAQRAGTAEPADYRLVPRLVSRIATEPLCRSTIEIIKIRKHAPLIPLTDVLPYAIIAITAAAIAVIAAASGKSRIRPAAIRPNEPPPRSHSLTDDEKMS